MQQIARSSDRGFTTLDAASPLSCNGGRGFVVVLHSQRTGVGTRQRLVGALDRAGLLRGVMQLRRLAPVPIVGIVTFHHIHDTADEPGYLYDPDAVSYTHLRAHETPEHLVCRLLLE